MSAQYQVRFVKVLVMHLIKPLIDICYRKVVTEFTLPPYFGKFIDLDFSALKSQCGIRAVVFDKDNTLTAPYVPSVHTNAQRGLNNALNTFGRSNVAILSNSAGTLDDCNHDDAKLIESLIGVRVVRHNEKKPGGLTELMMHFGSDVVDHPSQVCLVGDRLLTDVVFGNLYGMLTIHCEPLCKGKENAADNTAARVIRDMESLFLYGNWFVGRMILRRTIPHSVWPGDKICPLVLPSSAVCEDYPDNSKRNLDAKNL